MKKYFKTYTKKSLALLMTVMMLLSCWVFVAPEHNHASAVSAADVASTNQTAIGKLTGSTTINSVYGKYFTDDTKDASAAKDLYKNVAYSGTAQKVAGVTDQKIYDSGALKQYAVWYPVTVLMYDGITTPQFGVSILKDAKSGCKVTHWGTAISGTNLSFVNDNWYGVSDGSSNGKFLDPYNGGNQTAGLTYTGTTNKSSYHEGDKGAWYWMSNLIKYTGELTDKYYDSTTPNFSGYFSQPSHTGTKKTVDLGSASIPIYIIKTDTLKAAYAQVDSYKNLVLSNPSKYSTESVAKFVELANALTAVNPNAISWGTNTATQVTNYATNAKKAIDAWNAWVNAGGLQLATYTVTFVSSNGLYSDAKSVTYDGSVTVTFPEYTSDKTGHYKFEKWYESDQNTSIGEDLTITIENVQDDRTITAKYDTAEKHNQAGTKTHVTGTDTHKTTCNVCGWENDAVNCSFGDWTANGNTHTQKCSCGNTKSHEADWTEIDNPRYAVKGSSQGCDTDGLYYKGCAACDLIGTETYVKYPKTGHNYQLDTSKSEDHHCDRNSEATYVCQNCGVEKKSYYKLNADGTSTGELYDPAGHILKKGTKVPHTCTEPGYYWDECIYGDYKEKNYKYEDDPAGHTMSTVITDNGSGKHGYKCEKCDHWESLVDHTWELTDTITAPTCKAEGTGTYTCNVCGATKTDVIPADGKSHVLQNPTSNGNGTHSAKCTLCDYAADAVNCTNNGKCVCSVCGGKLAHDYSKEDPKSDALKSEADCNNAATYYYSCLVCGEVNTEGNTFISGDALGHKWQNAEDDLKSAATCEANEVYYQKCSRCQASSKDIDESKVYEKPNTALGHNFEAKAKNAKYTNGGHSYKCSRCDKYGFNGVVDATENCTYGSYTSTGAENHTRTCSVCGHVETTAHNMSEWKHVEGQDKHTRSCSVCSYIETEDCTFKTTTIAPTCTEPGKIGQVCEYCDNEKLTTDSNNPTALGHKYGDWKSNGDGTHSRVCANDANHVEKATCTGGTATCIEKATCKDCGGKYGDYAAHDFTGKYVSAGDGKHYRECSVDGCDAHGLDKVVGKTETCSGGTATCIKKAECDLCHAEYGDYAAHTFTGDCVNAGDGKHNYKCTTNGCTAVGVDGVEDATKACSGGTAYCKEKAICGSCGEQYGEFNKNNHKEDSLESMPGLAPTCMQVGYTEYQKCKDCGAEVDKNEIPVDPDNHKFDGEVVSNRNGTHTVHCSNKNAEGTAQCTATKTEKCTCENPRVIAPTCTEGGYTTNTCDKCEYEWRSEETTALGHDWKAWEYNETTGKHERTCTRCEVEAQTGSCVDSQTETVVKPTCTEKGYTLHTCTLCGHKWQTDETAATGHHYTEKIIDDEHKYAGKPASCTNAQYYWYDCADCDENAKDEKDNERYPANTLYYENGDGKGHVWEGTTVTSEYAIKATDATCTTNATYYIYCTKCGTSSSKIDESSADYGKTFEAYGTSLNHNYVTYDPTEVPSEGETAKHVYKATDATCTAKATYYKRCANCDEKGKETFEFGEMAKHSFTEEISDTAHRITKATCTTPAIYWYDCENCSLSAEFADKNGMDEAALRKLVYTDGDVDSSNHTNLVQVAVKNPTCLDAGHSAYKHCGACGANIGKVTAGYEKISHDFTGAYVITDVTADDGTVTHMHKRACAYGCGTYSDTVECTFGSYKQDAEKTDGKLTHTKTCVCGNKITENCTADGEATCTQAVTCTVCHGTMEAAGGHSYGNWISSGDGKTHYRVCSNDPSHKEIENCSGGVENGCGDIYCATCGQAYAKGDKHAWGEWKETTPATCTSPAVETRTCSACTKTETRDKGTALGHSYGEGEVATPATCTSDGVMKYTCTRNCGEYYTKTINKLGHKMGNYVITTEPTCKDEGEQTRYCQNSWKTADGKTVTCDYCEKQKVAKDETKHIPGEWEIVDGSGTCTQGIKKAKYCTLCDKCVDEEIVHIPHEWEEVKLTAATCLENGHIDMQCKNCGATEVFDDTCEGFPNKFDETTISAESAKKLVAKGSHTWRTEALDGETNYTIVDGCVVYITKDSTCSQTGRGYKKCDICGTNETTDVPTKEHTWNTIPASPASCTVPGYKEYRVCTSCPYTEQQVKIPPLGHEDKNGDGKCDRCYFEMYEKPSGGTSACGCICHSNSFFISKIIYPIARFFWKIFKTNKSCTCGRTHY